MIKPTSSASANVLLWIGAVAVMIFLIVPPLIIIPFSFSGVAYYQFPPQSFSLQWYQQLFGDPAWMQAIGNSAIVGISTAILTGIVGTAAAVGLARRRLPFLAVIADWLMFPMYLPTVVVAVGLYSFLAALGLIGTLGAVIFAHTLITLPVVILNVAAALQQFDRRVELAAQSLGARPARAFFAVTLPAIRSAILAGMLFAFVISLDELVIALFLSGTSAVTLPVQMWRGIRFENNPTIAAAGTVLMAIAALGLFLSERLRLRSLSLATEVHGSH